MNLFENMFKPQPNQNGDPRIMVIQMIESMKQSGKITADQYNILMSNNDNPQKMISAMLQNSMISNEQYLGARNNVQSFFGIK